METTQPKSEAAQVEQSKKLYHEPLLAKHGDLRKITAGTKTKDSKDSSDSKETKENG